MGFRVTSILSVHPDDKHAFFVYFVPGSSMAANWINNWVDTHFGDLAEQSGPNGMIVSPAGTRSIGRYIESLIETCFPDGRDRFGLVGQMGVDRLVWWQPDPFNPGREIAHTNIPFLIITRAPIHNLGESTDVLAINLSQCGNEQGLARIFDVVVEAIYHDDVDRIIRHRRLMTNPPQDKNVGLFDLVEFKPGIAGASVDVKRATEMVGRAVKDYIEHPAPD